MKSCAVLGGLCLVALVAGMNSWGCTERVEAVGTEEIENEIKYKLESEADYQTIIGLLTNGTYPVRELTIVNRYLDTPEHALSDKSVRARFRFIDGVPTKFTVKIPEGEITSEDEENDDLLQSGPARVARELSVDVDDLLALRIMNGMASLYDLKGKPSDTLISRLGEADLIRAIRDVGSIFTTRTEVGFTSEFKLEVDHFIIFGKSRYEIEVEVPPQLSVSSVDQTVQTFLRGAGVKFRVSKKSKSRRLFERLARQR